MFSLYLILAEPKDEIIPNNSPTQVAINGTEMICKFGALTLQVGDQIKSEKYCVECSCSLPPMVHCVQTGHC